MPWEPLKTSSRLTFNCSNSRLIGFNSLCSYDQWNRRSRLSRVYTRFSYVVWVNLQLPNNFDTVWSLWIYILARACWWRLNEVKTGPCSSGFKEQPILLVLVTNLLQRICSFEWRSDILPYVWPSKLYAQWTLRILCLLNKKIIRKTHLYSIQQAMENAMQITS